MTGGSASKNEAFDLVLYIAGQTPKSLIAIANLRKICAENITCKYHIEVVDLQKNPKLAKANQIVVVPTLIRKLPPPMKKIIGDLSNEEKVLVGLEIKAHEGGKR